MHIMYPVGSDNNLYLYAVIKYKIFILTLLNNIFRPEEIIERQNNPNTKTFLNRNTPVTNTKKNYVRSSLTDSLSQVTIYYIIIVVIFYIHDISIIYPRYILL